jgi:uncharacterized membrane protein YuzA (DUF378 family)
MEFIMKVVRFLAMVLMVIGALNWGSVGLFEYNFVGVILGGDLSGVARFVYILVGLAGLLGIGGLCRCCSKSCSCDSNCNCSKHKGHGTER